MACLNVLPDCSNCTNSGTECTKCTNGKFLSAITHTCIDTCEASYCNELTTFECISNTITNCGECKEGGALCLKCLNNKYLASNGLSCGDTCLFD